MKKYLKKSIVLMLSVVMILTSFTIPAYADGNDSTEIEEPSLESSGNALGASLQTTGEEVEDEDAEKIDVKNWMTALPDGLPINQINIPGTHDSGTAHVVGGSLLYFSTQDYQIDTQLNWGLRCLDIRVGSVGSEEEDTWKDLYIYHGTFPCTKYFTHLPWLKLTDVLEYCDEFLDDHPGETIILKIQQEHGGNGVIRCLKEMQSEFDYSKKNGRYRYYTHGDPVPTLGEVRGCVVIIDNDTNKGTYTKYEDHYEEISSAAKIPYVKASFDDSEPQNFLEKNPTFIKEAYENVDGPSGEPEVKVVYTSTNGVSKYAILAQSIHDCAELVNLFVRKYPLKKGIRYGWILMDFPNLSKINIARIIATNEPPVIDLVVDFAWEDDEAQHTEIPGFAIYEKNTRTFLAKQEKTVTGRNRVIYHGAPAFKGKYTCAYEIIPDVPDGYTYEIEYSRTSVSGAQFIKVAFVKPKPTYVKVNWEFCPERDDSSLEFCAYQETTEGTYRIMEQPVLETQFIKSEDDEAMYELRIPEPSYYDRNQVGVVIPTNSYYTYDQKKDVVRIDDHNFEITLHGAGPYKEYSGTITFIDDADSKKRRPPVDDYFWQRLKLVGTLDGNVTTEGTLEYDFSKYDSDGIITWKRSDVPIHDRNGRTYQWLVKYTNPTGYTMLTDGVDATMIPVPLENRSGSITFVDDPNSTRIRPAEDDPIFRELYFVGTLPDDGITEFDVTYDFSKYESQGIINWTASGMPVYYSGGQKIAWNLRIPDFYGYDSTINGNDLTLTRADDYTFVWTRWNDATAPEGSRPDKLDLALYCVTGMDPDADLTPVDVQTASEDSLWRVHFAPQKGNRTYIVRPVPGTYPEEYWLTGPTMLDKMMVLDMTYQARTYNVSIAGGYAEPLHADAGTVISVSADDAPDGKVFDRWETVYGDVEFLDAVDSETTFIMPEEDVRVQAVYKDAVPPGEYSVIALGGTADPESGDSGDYISLYADVLDGKHFVEWEIVSGNAQLEDAESEETGFYMEDSDVTVRAIFEDDEPEPLKYLVIVENGSADSNTAVGDTLVTVQAGPAPVGMEFDHWTVAEGDTEVADKLAETTTFVMPAENVRIKACYRTIPLDPPTYEIIEIDGTADLDEAAPGTDVSITANPAPDGMKFESWQVVSGDTKISNDTCAFANFVMPETGVTVKANYVETDAAEYSIIISGGTAGTEKAKPGTEITITADEPLNGQKFDGWEVISGEVKLTDAASKTAGFEMPAGDVVIRAICSIEEDEINEYTIIKGDGQTYTTGSGKILSFTCDGALEKASSLYIDDQKIGNDYYDAESGSTIANLKTEFLDGLSIGTHTIRFIYSDGESNIGSFTVTSPNVKPDDSSDKDSSGTSEGDNSKSKKSSGASTGDNSHVYLWLILVLVCAAAVSAGVRKRGK